MFTGKNRYCSAVYVAGSSTFARVLIFSVE
jgi:hypothetical protein